MVLIFCLIFQNKIKLPSDSNDSNRNYQFILNLLHKLNIMIKDVRDEAPLTEGGV